MADQQPSHTPALVDVLSARAPERPLVTVTPEGLRAAADVLPVVVGEPAVVLHSRLVRERGPRLLPELGGRLAGHTLVLVLGQRSGVALCGRAGDGADAGATLVVTDPTEVREVVEEAAATSGAPAEQLRRACAGIHAEPPFGASSCAALVAAIDRGVGGVLAAVAARLHDGPVQELTAAQLFLDSGMESAPELVERGVDALRSAAASSRSLIGELLRAPGEQG